MKTKWRLYILWSVLSLGLLSCAVDTYEFRSNRRKKVSKLGKYTPIKQPTITGDREFSQRLLPASTSPLVPETPRAMLPEESHAKIRSGFAYLPDVSASCSTSDFVVRVKPTFYGQGAHAEELTIGSNCKSNGVLRPYGDLLFTYPLTACDAVRQLPNGYLVYKFVLHYEPSPKRFPRRAQRMDVDIECRYQRNHHVYQLTVRPTWETTIMRQKLKGNSKDFQIELMDDSWSGPAKSHVYHLGKPINLQISAPHLPAGGKLYINSCYATPFSASQSSLKYTIIDNFGCILDSKRDPGGSGFISRTNKTLMLSLKAFQFTSNPDTEVNIHCKLFITSEDPSPEYKSCTYKGNRWEALTGDDSVCECCDSHCVPSKSRRAVIEGSASSGSLLVSDQPHTAEESFLPVGLSGEGKATIHHYIDELHSHDNLWDNEDEVISYENGEEQGFIDVDDDDDDEEHFDEDESGVILEVMTQPDLDELGFRENVLVEGRKGPEVNDSHLFKEDGSGYGKAFSHWVENVLPLQPEVSEGEEEHRKHTGRSGDDERITAAELEWKNDEDLVDDEEEMTWYFTWR